MKLIPLTQLKHAVVDDDLFSTLSTFKWFAQKSADGRFYAARKATVAGGGKQRVISMHRQILFGEDSAHYKAIRTFHEDGDSLNNARKNIKAYVPSSSSFSGPLPPGVELVPRKKRLPTGLVAVEGTAERILFARGFGRLDGKSMTGFVVRSNGGYIGPVRSYSDAVDDFVRLHGDSFITKEERESDPLIRLHNALPDARKCVCDAVDAHFYSPVATSPVPVDPRAAAVARDRQLDRELVRGIFKGDEIGSIFDDGHIEDVEGIL